MLFFQIEMILAQPRLQAITCHAT